MAWSSARRGAPRELERAFATFDVDGSGTIDRIEFEDLIRYCAGTIRLSDERVAELWDEMNALEGDDEARADDAQSIAMPHAFAIVCHRYGLYVSTHTPPPDAEARVGGARKACPGPGWGGASPTRRCPRSGRGWGPPQPTGSNPSRACRGEREK